MVVLISVPPSCPSSAPVQKALTEFVCLLNFADKEFVLPVLFVGGSHRAIDSD